MTCWHGHLPHMTEEQVHQATEAYYRAQYAEAWRRAWQSPMNPLRDEPAEPAPPRRKPALEPHPGATSLQAARRSDKAGAIDVEFVRVR